MVKMFGKFRGLEKPLLHYVIIVKDMIELIVMPKAPRALILRFTQSPTRNSKYSDTNAYHYCIGEWVPHGRSGRSATSVLDSLTSCATRVEVFAWLYPTFAIRPVRRRKKKRCCTNRKDSVRNL